MFPIPCSDLNNDIFIEIAAIFYKCQHLGEMLQSLSKISIQLN